MNNPNKNSPVVIGDKLIYYGGMIATIGSIISFAGSTIIYEQRILGKKPTDVNTIGIHQFNHMQKQIHELQRKIDEMEKRGNT
ncbi:hypothetical protein [Oceanobacillus saliphilus]|uniref:hypothetical protein n=1 Tax=Oceanobacillus saliphilus TaxID=2925834 RepID=UPI00201DA6AB|nr:hypothetical protein [Oceanobacillus saliphilus]